MTIEGIAKGLDLGIEISESIVERLCRATGGALNESQRKMAQIPAGSTLLDAGDLWFPLVVVRNVFIFPGVPELLRKKFASVRDRFRGVPFVLKRVYVRSYESEIAASLHELLREFPKLLLGSYPRLGEEEFRVMLTLESRDAAYLDRALGSLLARLPTSSIYLVE